MAGASVPVLVALGLLGLVGGVGITAVGPGGVLPTIGLFALTGLTPAQVAGTALVTHVATGMLATAAYTRSGQLREPGTRRTALVLAVSAVAGTPLGVLVNSYVSKRMFGLVLGVFVAGVAGLVWFREHRRPAGSRAHPPTAVVAGTGCAVAVAAGVVGIGGPMLTVPLLVALGVPVLESSPRRRRSPSSSPVWAPWVTWPRGPSTGRWRCWSGFPSWRGCCWAGGSRTRCPPAI